MPRRVLPFLGLALLAACNDPGSPGVRGPAVRAVVVTPARESLLVADSLRFTALAQDSAGGLVEGVQIGWRSLDAGVATVSAAGMVRVVAEGTARVVAEAGAAQVADTAVVVAFAPIPFTAIDAGYSHSCGVVAGAPGVAGGAAYCWGANRWWQLGSGSTDEEAHPRPVRVAGGLAFASVTAGERHSCGLTAAGEAYCWGDNGVGQLGDNSTRASTVPVPVAGGLAFTRLSAGVTHTCGVAADGAAYCWGSGNAGELGDSSFTDDSIPSRVRGGHAFAEISAGSQQTCALTTGGDAYCWGWRVFILGADLPLGQAPRATIAPARTAPGLRLTRIDLGTDGHVCGIDEAAAAYCWGVSNYGQLGNGSPGIEPARTPQAVLGDLRFAAISAGNGASCGVTVEGAIYCWGRNTFGQLGDGTSTNRSAPVEVSVATAPGASTISVSLHACAVTAAGGYCWGLGEDGRLGTGRLASMLVPVRVGFARIGL